MNVRRTIGVAGVMMLLLACSGCRAVGNYVCSRSLDFLDVFNAELTVGPGLDVHANVTEYFGAAVGVSYQNGFMKYDRSIYCGRRDTVGVLLLAGTDTVPCNCDELFMARGRRPGIRRGWRLFLPWSLFPGSPSDVYLRKWPENLDLEVGGSVLIVGAHVGVSVGQALDFLLGIVTLDPAYDDLLPAPKHEDATEQAEQ